MPPEIIGLLLCAAIALLWWQDRRQAEPTVTVCRCGDLIQHIPGWPTRCPSCSAFIL